MKDARLRFLIIIIFIFGILIIGKLFYLQIIHYKFYKSQAGIQRNVVQKIEAKRGLIKDINGRLLATNINTYVLSVAPALIKDRKMVADQLISLLNISDDRSLEFDNLLKKLSQENDFYEILEKDISPETANKIKELNLLGVNIEVGQKRFYPEGQFFSHVLGFVGVKNNAISGQYGVEEFLENILAGQPGFIEGERAPDGTLILDSAKIIKKPINGADIVLTIDGFIQNAVCQFLADGIRNTDGDSGTAIIIEPKTGKILSLCVYPTFDNNNYQKVKDYKLFINSAVSNAFEPGSIFKIITMAAGLDSGQVTPETTYIDNGEVKIGGYTIKNSNGKAYGLKTMTNVLEMSLNTGAVFVARTLGKDFFRNYVKQFGFGALTGIEQPAEATGDISNLEKSGEIYLATSSFGQGITVTPIQMLTAVAAIANQGKLMQPYLVDRIIQNGQIQNQNQPKFLRQVISSSTAITLSSMMVSVLENGYGKLARVSGYWVAGKTGTAQVADEKGNYSENKSIHSFVGFAPVDNPVFAGIIKIDNPKKGRFAESTAAPIFGKIAEYILKYYNVPPSR